jgi:hypothetical protein
MKKQILLVIFVTILACFLGAFSAICGEVEKDTRLKNYYEDFITSKISKCYSKAQLKKSKSVHLQSCAAKEVKKAIFLSENKEMLIDEMIKRDIGVKTYKIEYFLNGKFYESSVISGRYKEKNYN